MPSRSLANKSQREFFADISKLNGIALTTKRTEALSINIHGAFTLFDKHWPSVRENNDETMLALKEAGLAELRGEPAVHFHVDWRTIKWARIQRRHLELISTDYEIVFCEENDTSTRVFWFYLREGFDTQYLLAKWGSEWISLSENETFIYENLARVQGNQEVSVPMFN